MRFTKALFLLSSIVFSTISSAETVGGEFSCKVQSVQITQVKEGRATTFSGMSGKDAINVEDTLSVNYYDDGSGIFYVFVNEKLYGDYLKGKLKGKYIEYNSLIPQYQFFMTDDVFHSTFDGSTIELQRYYKSDWDGFYNEIRNDYVKTFGLDCRTIKDGYEELKQLVEGIK